MPHTFWYFFNCVDSKYALIVSELMSILSSSFILFFDYGVEIIFFIVSGMLNHGSPQTGAGEPGPPAFMERKKHLPLELN